MKEKQWWMNTAVLVIGTVGPITWFISLSVLHDRDRKELGAEVQKIMAQANQRPNDLAALKAIKVQNVPAQFVCAWDRYLDAVEFAQTGVRNEGQQVESVADATDECERVQVDFTEEKSWGYILTGKEPRPSPRIVQPL